MVWGRRLFAALARLADMRRSERKCAEPVEMGLPSAVGLAVLECFALLARGLSAAR